MEIKELIGSELHYIKVESRQFSTNVNSKTSGSIHNGSGYIGSKTESNELAVVTCDRKSYRINMSQNPISISETDELVCLCRKDDSTGVYDVLLLCNISTGSMVCKLHTPEDTIESGQYTRAYIGGVLTSWIFGMGLLFMLYTYHLQTEAKSQYPYYKQFFDNIVSCLDLREHDELSNRVRDIESEYGIKGFVYPNN